ncbi:unnamed protein product [Symbiodinium sp. KB8]|nr:unnamed protein product [Symbiodinium sp. KB8]
MRGVAAALCALLLARGSDASACAHLNNCNSHGTCDETNRVCRCFDGFGSESDLAVYKAPDCSQREDSQARAQGLAVQGGEGPGVCPADKAWVDIPTGATTAHNNAECSNAGICDRGTGRCRCFAGFEGDACQRCEISGPPRGAALLQGRQARAMRCVGTASLRVAPTPPRRCFPALGLLVSSHCQGLPPRGLPSDAGPAFRGPAGRERTRALATLGCSRPRHATLHPARPSLAPSRPCCAASCPNGCSGHGKCVSMSQMAGEANAFPVGPATTYGGFESTVTWDENKIFGCVCDSIWTVGFGAGQTQATSWFGADCSQRRCPSGDDASTELRDETDCSYYTDNGETWHGAVLSDGTPDRANPGTGVTGTLGVDFGAVGNKCHVDCSNRGICDRTSGLCKCFRGYYGQNCGLRSALAKGEA